MTIRVHGAVGANRLGYFMGENALVSIVIKNGSIDFAETGVLATLKEFKYLYALDQAVDIAAQVDADGPTVVNDYGGTTGAGVATVANIGAAQRTFKGVVLASDAEYIAAYSAQHNLRLLIDTVQQRAVILGISPAGRIAADVTLAGYDKALTGTTADTSAVSIFIERADVMDKYPINTYGQLAGAVVPAGELLAGLSGLTFMAMAGGDATVVSGEYAVKVSRSIPQVL